MFNSEVVTTSEPFKLRDDKYTLLFDVPNTNRDFLFCRSKAFNTAVKFLVFGVSKLKSSKTIIDFSFALIDKADFLAKRFKFLFNLKD